MNVVSLGVSVIPNFDNLGFATLPLPLFGVWDCLKTLLATRRRKIKASNVRNCSGRLRRKHLGHLESFKRQHMPCIACTKTTTCRDHLTIRPFPFYLGRVRGMLVRCRTLRRVEIGINKIHRRKIGMAIECSVTFSQRTPCWIFAVTNFRQVQTHWWLLGQFIFQCLLFHEGV